VDTTEVQLSTTQEFDEHRNAWKIIKHIPRDQTTTELQSRCVCLSIVDLIPDVTSS